MLDVEELRRSPAWLPLGYLAGGGGLTAVELDASGYRAASFLDERLLEGPIPRSSLSVETLEAAAAAIDPRSHYIFHIGHVGSTLISRLVGEHDALFSLREPSLLRALAAGASPQSFPISLGTVTALLARTWRADQRSIIKATSIVNELAEAILAGPGRPAAVFMFTDPLTYLRSILGGPNSRRESKIMAPGRARRLGRRLRIGGLRVEAAAEGEQIAANWLSEMAALHQAAAHAPSRVLWVNFDRFLSEPSAGLGAIFRAFGADAGGAEVDALVTGPLMQRYSKAPEYAYDAALRREVLRAADFEHGAEIDRGMQWLTRMAHSHAPVRSIIEECARR